MTARSAGLKVTGVQFHPTMPSVEKVRIHRAECVHAEGGQSATVSSEETFSHTAVFDFFLNTNKVPEVFTNVLFHC